MTRTPPHLLLLTSESPHFAAAGAIVLLRVLQDYPAERLHIITNHPPPTGAARLACPYVSLNLFADRLNRTRFWLWRPLLRAFGGPDLIRLSRIDRRLGGFRPDLVVTLMQDSWFYDLSARYARRRGLPLVVLIHDEPSGFEPVASKWRLRQHRRDAAVYRQAVRRLCISPGMEAHFRSTFGIDGQVLLPPRSERIPQSPPERCRSLKDSGRLTIGYAGGLHYGYGEQLLRLIPAFRACGTRVEIFGPAPTGPLAPLAAATDVFRFNGYISPPETAWRLLLQQCDVVLQPYLNPPGPHEPQYRTHFPSKLGDCLSLGIPLLITGPAYASGMRWCLEHPGAAVEVTDPNPAAFLGALRRLIEEPELRVALARHAQEVAPTFDAPPIREQFVQAVSAAVDQGNSTPRRRWSYNPEQ